MTIRTLAALGLSAALCLPAAAYDDSANVNAAYERGKAWGTSAGTRSELVECVAFWHVWGEFHEDMFSAAMLENLAPALREPQVAAALRYWDQKASAAFDGLEDGEAQFQALAKEHLQVAWEEGEGVAYGEDYIFAEMLGACAVPDQN